MASQPEPEPEPEPEPSSTPPTLPITSLPYLKHPQHYSGALTPLHTLASVPFSWEQEPGKPLPCLALALPSSHHNIMKCLGLPPRLLNDTKTPSPTTVLEGPYNSLGRSILGSTSFRIFKKRQKSFDRALSFSRSVGNSPERELLSTVVISRNSEKKDKGLFGTWRKKGEANCKGKNEGHGGSFVFPSISDDGTGSCCDGDAPVQVGRVCRKSGQLGLSQTKSHFWATIYGIFKQVIPRKSTKFKKDAM